MTEPDLQTQLAVVTAERDELRSKLVAREQADERVTSAARTLGAKIVRAFLGKELDSSLRAVITAGYARRIPTEGETTSLAAALARRIIRVGLVTVAVALIGEFLLFAQVHLMDEQNGLILDQNHAILSQIELQREQNASLQTQLSIQQSQFDSLRADELIRRILDARECKAIDPQWCERAQPEALYVAAVRELTAIRRRHDEVFTIESLFLRSFAFDSLDLSRAHLLWPQAQGAGLEDVVMDAATIIGGDFGVGNMKRMSFIGARVGAGNFQGADLTGSDFRAAVVGSADFSGANLTRVDFRGADLTGARFHGANMTGVLLDGANIGYALFGPIPENHTSWERDVERRNVTPAHVAQRILGIRNQIAGKSADFSGVLSPIVAGHAPEGTTIKSALELPVCPQSRFGPTFCEDGKDSMGPPMDAHINPDYGWNRLRIEAIACIAYNEPELESVLASTAPSQIRDAIARELNSLVDNDGRRHEPTAFPDCERFKSR